MKLIDNIKININTTVKEALQIIDNSSLQIALVINKDEKLIGTLTDGDIRRGLLRGLDLNCTIETIYNKTPTVAKVGDNADKILSLAIDKKLRQVPIVDAAGKVVDIKEIDDFIKPHPKLNKVILMAGGLGERLRPLTIDTPKPMLNVGNKPILQTIIEKFKENGYSNFIICLNYKSDIIQEYFKDGSEFGINIEYVIEEQRLGTAGALSLINDISNEPFFVMNGDILTNINFSQLHEYHNSSNSIATMCVRDYNFQIPYGVVELEGTNIISIQEKPHQKYFVSAGIYMFSHEVLNYIPKNEYFDMPTLFEKLIADGKNAISFPLREYWLDIGKIEEYNRANDEFFEIF